MKIAIVGAGITGLGAAWLLSRQHDVTVYEADDRLGGHANTVVAPAHGRHGPQPVDTGFIVYNERTYPNLIALFDALDVPTKESEMSFAVSLGGGRLEYSGDGVRGLYAQPSTLLSPSHHRMVFDVLRFFREAPKVLETRDGGADQSLGDYLAERRYSHAFIDAHLLPMASAIWSASLDDVLAFPIRSFVRFFQNHGLLQLTRRPLWRTVDGGSREYVSRLAETLRGLARIRLGAPVTAVDRTPIGVRVTTPGSEAEGYDAVVLACHADQALGLLTDPDDGERRVLSAFRYAYNRAILHRDPRLMPQRRRIWSSWNYMAGDAIDWRRPERGRPTSVSYSMNVLQSIPDDNPLFVSVNPLVEPREECVIGQWAYAHPQFDRAAIAAQGALGAIQGKRGVWFCGAYTGYGFHEDGLASGLAVAEALGARRPWAATEVSTAYAHTRPADDASTIPSPVAAE